MPTLAPALDDRPCSSVVARVTAHRRTIHGFTLVELLVVIAIIAALLGLLLPAVQSARESARRTQCMVNMRSVGQGFLLCADAKGWFPAAMYSTKSGTMNPKPTGNPSGTEHSWRMLVMPFLEEKKAADEYSWKKHWFDATSNATPATPADSRTGVPPDSNLGIGLTQVQVFQCPSSPARPSSLAIPVSPDSDSARPALPALLVPLATSDFEVVTGVKKSVLSPDPYASGGSNSVGILDKDVVTKPAQIADGTTKTILLAECAGRPLVYRGGAVQMSGAAPEVNQCVGWLDNLGPFKIDPMRGDGVKSPKAAANAGVAMNATNDGECYGFHPGGIVVTFGDTSTRVIADSIALRTFCALVTRAGNEQAGEIP
ncbi:MAG: DUF1559 domain-containing protein [Planctomycetaceae bacterium]